MSATSRNNNHLPNALIYYEFYQMYQMEPGFEILLGVQRLIELLLYQIKCVSTCLESTESLTGCSEVNEFQ